MNKLIKKLTTWLLVFGMTFTPVLTSINVIAVNAEDEGGSTTIDANTDSQGEDGEGEDEGEVVETPAPSQDVQEVIDAADAASEAEAPLGEKVEAVDDAVDELGLPAPFFFFVDPITGANGALKTSTKQWKRQPEKQPMLIRLLKILIQNSTRQLQGSVP